MKPKSLDLRLVIGIFTLLISTIGGILTWALNMRSDLNNLGKDVSILQVSDEEMEKEVKKMKNTVYGIVFLIVKDQEDTGLLEGLLKE